MILARLIFASLLSRWITVVLTICAIALSVMLLLGVEKIRTGAKSSFTDTISDTDLIVGARSGSVQLLLYSVFRIGSATNNMTWESYQDIAQHPDVDWSVPISLGDSHKQFRVMGTTSEYFTRYKYRGGQPLAFAQGQSFDDIFDAVIGADVAETLGYTLDDPIIIAHGIASFTEHKDQPFRISGILAKTGTPVDRTVIVSLAAIEAIHIGWESGAQQAGQILPADVIRQMEFTPKAITAAMIGVKSRLKVFHLQRAINEYSEEPLMAVLPGVALSELWQIVGAAETALIAVSTMVVITALLGLATMIFAGLNERRREMAILRATGAKPITIFGLLIAEAVFMTCAGTVFGSVLLYTALWVAQPYIDLVFGIYIKIEFLSAQESGMMLSVIGAGGVASLLPALRAYRISLADGMTVRH